MLIWDEVEDATYQVSILDEDYDTDVASLDVSFLKNGIYDIIIYTFIDNNTYEDMFEITVDRYYSKPQMISHQRQTLTFVGDGDALRYEIWMNGHLIDSDDTFVDVGPLTINTLYHIQVRALYNQEAGLWSESYLIDTHEDLLDVMTHVYDPLDDEDFILTMNSSHTFRVLNDSVDIKEDNESIQINKDDLNMLESDSVYVIEDTGDTNIIHHIKIRDINHSYLRSEQTLHIEDDLSVLFHLVEGAEITFYLGENVLSHVSQNGLILINKEDIEAYLEINEKATISYIIEEKHINIIGYLIILTA